MKWSLIKRPDKGRELRIELPPEMEWHWSGDVQREVMRIVANQLVDMHGADIIKKATPKVLQQAFEQALIERLIGRGGR